MDAKIGFIHQMALGDAAVFPPDDPTCTKTPEGPPAHEMGLFSPEPFWCCKCSMAALRDSLNCLRQAASIQDKVKPFISLETQVGHHLTCQYPEAVKTAMPQKELAALVIILVKPLLFLRLEFISFPSNYRKSQKRHCIGFRVNELRASPTLI